MARTETKTAIAVELELPPNGGNLSVVSTLDEDAHYLRVTLDKSENFKVAAGEKLRDLLQNKFGNNRNALRDWYEGTVVQGKAHRAWSTVAVYLGVVIAHGDEAAAVFAEREKWRREYEREHQRDLRKYERERREQFNANETVNNINAPGRRSRAVIPEYDQRKAWLSDMNVLWFKAEREWQDRWLQDRQLLRGREL